MVIPWVLRLLQKTPHTQKWNLAYIIFNYMYEGTQRLSWLFIFKYLYANIKYMIYSVSMVLQCLFRQMAVLCCFFVAVILFSFACLQNILGFYVVFATVMSMFAFPSLYVLLGQNFVKWTWQYVTESPDKVDQDNRKYFEEINNVKYIDYILFVACLPVHISRVWLNFIISRYTCLHIGPPVQG